MMRTNNRNYLNKKTQVGFSILEVIVALAIVAIMVAGVTIFIGTNHKGELKNHAYKLLGQLQIAQEESIIRGVEFGLRVEDDGYSFLIYNNEKWQALEDHELLKSAEFESPYALYVNVEGQESLLKNASRDSDEDKDSENTDNELAEENKAVKIPQIFMLSSGEMNQFYLTIGLDESEEVFYRIAGNYLGDFKISEPLEGNYQSDWDKELDKVRDKEDFYAQ